MIYYLLQWTWGIIQNLTGLTLYLIYSGCSRKKYKKAVVTNWKVKNSLSMGMFLFVNPEGGERLEYHEYGHSVQSALLGPFYLPVIGIASFVWCNFPYFRRKRQNLHISYFSPWMERWADRLGMSGDSKKLNA